MAAGHVNRTALSSNYQNVGDVYSDLKTEGAMEVIAQQIDDNYDNTVNIGNGLTSHKNAGVLDHPDGSVTTAKMASKSVTTEKIADAAVGLSQLAPGALVNESVNNMLITALKADIAIGITSFGFVGDGVYDDATAIQRAVDYATSLIQQKSSATDVFAAQVTIQLPPKKIYIKSKINVPNAITIQGHGTATTLVLLANLDYVFDFNNNLTGAVTKNEENQMEGGGLRNLRISGNKRAYTLTSAVRIYNVDHFVIDCVYFYAIKGKCVELKSARECNFNNIFTRFCGTTTQGNIEIVAESGGSDTSNLNFGLNWSIIFPYGPALKIVNTTAGSTNFANIEGLLVHGIFSTVNSSLATYFGVNEYNTSGSNQIDITNGEIRLSGGNFVYCPNLNSYVKMNNSTVFIANSKMSGHYTANETHGSGDYFFYLSNTSTLYLEGGIKAQSAFQNTDVFFADGTSFIYGSLQDLYSAQWLNAPVAKKVVASEIQLWSDVTSSIKIKPRATQAASVVAGVGRMMYEIYTASDLNTPILQMGTNQGITYPLLAIPDNVMFKLPSNVSGRITQINSQAWIDSTTFNLKVNLNGAVTNVMTSSSGSTGSRPTVGLYVGLPYFDTTLGKPVWVKTTGYEVETLTVTAGATSSGNITITLNGAATTVAVLAGDSTSAIATKINNTTFSAWTTSVSGSVVTFTRSTAGANSAPTFSGGTTGTTAGMVQTVGSATAWVDATGTTV